MVDKWDEFNQVGWTVKLGVNQKCDFSKIHIEILKKVDFREEPNPDTPKIKNCVYIPS